VQVTGGVVTLNYEDLLADRDLSDSIGQAFGHDGLGLLIVKGVPEFTDLRQKLLPLAHRFASLPNEVKEKMVHKDSFYSFGWSHGKEVLEGKPDVSKGSYYNNPIHNRPIEDEELIKKYPAFAHPNIWPSDDLPELETAFLGMGRLIVDVGTLVAKQCDRYVAKMVPNYAQARLQTIVSSSLTHKARLLHYFPLAAQDDSKPDSAELSGSWCGWHNDHGSLTGLVPAMYIDADGNAISNPDPNSGLYIRSRSGALIQAKFPADHLAFQIGETAQIHSGGVLQATPHCVLGARGPAAAGVSRETFAVFMEPMWNEKMDIPMGIGEQEFSRGSTSQHLPRGVPSLESRWKADQDFGMFTEVTLKSYY